MYKMAKQLAEVNKFPSAYSYDLFYRDFDKQVEVIGLVDDPNYNMKDFAGREMLFPKKWVTLDVLETSMRVAA
jgi:hypothetical protein